MLSLGSIHAAEWTSATDGDWTTAANWTDGVVPSSTEWAYITNNTGSAAYKVTLESDTDQAASGLTLRGKTTSLDKNGSLTYWTDLDVKSALSLTGSFAVNYGGRMNLPSGGSLAFSGSSSIGNIGQVFVTGGSLTGSAVTGFAVSGDAWGGGSAGNPPKLSIASGSVDLTFSGSGAMSLQNYAQLLMTGGKMTLAASGATTDALWTQCYNNRVQCDLSNDAELSVSKGAMSFGAGIVNVSDSAKLTCAGRLSFLPYYSDNSKRIDVDISGSAKVSSDTLEVGKPDARTTGTAINVNVSGGEMTTSYRGYVGTGTGTYTINLTGGTMTFAGCGLRLGSMPLVASNTSTDRHFQNTTVMSVKDGAALLVSSEKNQYTSELAELWGFVIGYGLCGTRDDYMFRGRLEIGENGCVTNGVASAPATRCPIFIGAGYATGVVYQTSGEFRSLGSDTPQSTLNNGSLVLGVYGGYGAYEMTGGKASIDTPVWIGGTTSAMGRSLSSSVLPTDYAGKSVGELKLSGGAMTLSRNVYVGTDGQGAIELSGDAALTIGGDLVLSNSVGSASATLEFALTDAKVPLLTCAGSLTISDGARLVVDATNLKHRGRYRIFSSATSLPDFAASQIELKDAADGKLSTLSFKDTTEVHEIWYVRRGGFIIIAR